METFASLGVKPWLLNSLTALQIKKPTPVQVQTIPAILQGSDCIAKSQTGSGKTIAFSLPILQRWGEDGFGIYALVLTPTRELALQIFEQLKALSGSSNLKVVLVIGGMDMTQQAIALSSRPHIVVATPGRLADHIQSSGEETIAGLRKIKFVVLDEADRLLSPGHGSMLPDIERCFEVLPPTEDRQTLLFTATMSEEVRHLQNKPKPENRPPIKVVEIGTNNIVVPSTLKQTYILVPTTQREVYLHVLLNTPMNIPKSFIIFCNRASTATYLEYLLRLLGHRITALHSGLKQRERINNLAKFRAKVASILVATDVASRGLDIPSVDFVINYDVSRDPDDYIHRVGRTARAGRNGLATTFIGQRDVLLVLAIEDRVGAKLIEFEEKNVSIEGRVTKETTLKQVGDAKREAVVRIEEGRDVKGKRTRLKLKRNNT